VAYKINMPEREDFWEQFYMPGDIDYEFAARASEEFHFDLSDADIWVETAAGNSAVLALSNDHQIHTASFGLTSRFGNGLEKGAGFIVHAEGGEVELLFVRLVFQP
jgi:hypothetical protein